MLVVEGDTKLRQAVQTALNSGGYQADGAESGGAAVACVASATYDAVVLGRRLPDMPIADLLQRLRIAAGDVPVIFGGDARLLGAPRPAAHGELAVADDVLERVSLATLQEENRRLRRHLLSLGKSATAGALAASVAHELNNPATYLVAGLAEIEALVQSLAHLESIYREQLHLAGGEAATFGASRALAAAGVEQVGQNLARASSECRDGARRMQQILRNFRALAAAQRDTVTPTAVDAQEAVDAALALVERELSMRARVERHYAAVPLVHADRGGLIHAVLNLLTNAAQAVEHAAYAPGARRPAMGARGAGDHIVRVTTAVGPSRDLVEVRVSDSGQGVPAAMRDRIFEPFFAAREGGPEGSAPGPGIGLALASEALAQFGASIALGTSELGGATFVIRVPTFGAATAAAGIAGRPGAGAFGLPRMSAPPAQPAPARPAATPLSYAPPTRPAAAAPPVPGPRASQGGAGAGGAAGVRAGARRRVLLIDDDPLVRQACRIVLGTAHDVSMAPSGREAIEMLARGDDFDVVLCDLMMPDVAGPDIHRFLAMNRPDLLERLVFLTGGAFTADAREFLQGLPNRVVFKPFDVNDLLAVIAEVGRSALHDGGAGHVADGSTGGGVLQSAPIGSGGHAGRG